MKMKLLILYGTQTGTAEDVAERMAREAIRRKCDPYISSMENYDPEKLPDVSLVCFIASTTGQGEEPSNMKKFWKYLLKRSLPRDWLSAVDFTVLGLGDSSYVKFNFVGKKLFKRLVDLGANPVIPIFLADDQHDLGADFVIEQWISEFWETASKNLPSGNLSNAPLPLTVLKPKFSLVQEGSPRRQDEPKNHPVRPFVFHSGTRQTAEDHFQDVRLFQFTIPDDTYYDPGDVLMVQPSNSEETVEHFFEVFPHLNDQRNVSANVVPNYAWATVPPQIYQTHGSSWTLSQLVKHYFDVQAVPNRYFFEILARFTTSELEAERLNEFASVNGQQDLNSYCNRPKRSALEVLQDFPYAVPNIPIDMFFELFHPIKPRAFSIASSKKEPHGKLRILVAIVNYQTKLKKPRLGLCSNFLASRQPGDLVPCWIERGSFRFPPPEQHTPVIMVGPGTGVAPFVSFISDRIGTSKGFTLFFGCRYEQKDYYFRNYWDELQQKHDLCVIAAFSRDNPGSSRVYVQHKIEEHGEQLWDLINNHDAFIYVAGNAKNMPTNVSDAFVSIFRKNGCPDPEEYMKYLMKVNRYQTEVW